MAALSSPSPAPPPLTGIRVLEFAGLAPGPFAGMLLADFGASVLRIDRAIRPNTKTGHPGTHVDGSTGSAAAALPSPAAPTPDMLARHKTSIAVDLKSAQGRAFILSLIRHVDVLIDPFRPGVLEKLGLCPTTVLQPLNPALVTARLTGFRRDGKYATMAGHDINYIAVSGVLDMFGRRGGAPVPPGNVVGDFAGGGAMCVLGILMALLARDRAGGRAGGGKGQVVEANMVDGAAYLATMPRMGTKLPLWNGPRGTNLLDTGCPFYDSYETKDGKYIAVGALEPQFFAALLKGLDISPSSLPGPRDDKATWPALRALFTDKFRARTRDEWETVFDRTDACVTPIFSHAELEQRGFDQRPAVTLRSTPGFAIAHETEVDSTGAGQDGAAAADPKPAPEARGQGPGTPGEGWYPAAIGPGEGGEHTLAQWLGWERGRDYDVHEGGLVPLSASNKDKRGTSRL